MKQETASQHIESALESAEVLIGDLLDISRLESGKMKARIESFPLREVFDALEAEFGVLARRQGLRFSCLPQPGDCAF
nr:hypothetical protein [Salinivibrio socompensis]